MSRNTPGRDWGLWVLGFLAGAAVATWITLSTHPAGAQSPEVREALVSASDAYGVPYTTLSRVAWCESRFDPAQTSWAGAQGLMQFMPRTWAWMSAQAGWKGWSAYHPRAAAHVAAWAFSRGYGPQHWRACW
jgi:hypothetical protein